MADMHGAVERIDATRIGGWARASAGSARVAVTILADDAVIGFGMTDRPRDDLGGDHGFWVEYAAPVDPLHVLAGRVRVIASAGAAWGCLPLLPSARSQVLARLVGATMQDFGADDIARVREAIGALPQAVPAGPIAARELPGKQQTRLLLEQAGHRQAASALTSVPVPVGFVCADGSALIGHDGEVYLVGGGNDVLRQFLTPPDDAGVARLAAAWHAAIRARARAVTAGGGRFLQIIIPEKLSAYPRCFPVKVTTPSPLLGQLEARLEASELACATVFGLRELLAAVPPAQIFPRFDSHLTARATHALFGALLRAMGLVNPFPLELSARRFAVGDLAERFLEAPLHEEYVMPGVEFAGRITGRLELAVREVPPAGHAGIRFVWRNPAAPFDLRVVAFANSFFERGGDARSLSWWCARAFREFHFLWAPELDMDYVRREAPDWVICQTIERFLPLLPQDRG